MNYKIFESKQNNKVYRIEEDYPEIGAYLYIFEKEICIYDSLQNSVEECKSLAFEEFKIPTESWVLIEQHKSH